MKKEAILFGIFFLPPFRRPDNSEEQQEQEGCARNVFGNLFLEVKSCCSLRVRFGNLS